ncbi:MAG: hypothetical protein ACFB6R_03580 [Alphaproteobacteria bacterium]
MKNVLRSALVPAMLVPAMLVSGAQAHPAKDHPAEPGPVPQILMEHGPIMIYENGTLIPFVVREDKSLFWFEMFPETDKSVAGGGTWTWNGEEFCMIIDNHPDVCMALEAELQPGKVYDSTVRFLDPETKKEKGSKPFKFVMARTD